MIEERTIIWKKFSDIISGVFDYNEYVLENIGDRISIFEISVDTSHVKIRREIVGNIAIKPLYLRTELEFNSKLNCYIRQTFANRIFTKKHSYTNERISSRRYNVQSENYTANLFSGDSPNLLLANKNSSDIHISSLTENKISLEYRVFDTIDNLDSLLDNYKFFNSVVEQIALHPGKMKKN